jgi:hypothetical protein
MFGRRKCVTNKGVNSSYFRMTDELRVDIPFRTDRISGPLYIYLEKAAAV